MALVVKDRVQETSTTTGTGTLTLSGAVTGFQTFSSAIGNTNTTYYTIQNGSEWEVGIGTVGAGTLSRDTVLESSNSGSLVNLSSGTKNVFCTYPAEKSVDIDTAQTLTNKTISGSSNTLSNIGNSSLSNSSITINGTPVSLGSSISVPASITWQTVQTTGFTASAGNGYPVNTTSGAITVTLPASPSAGNTISIIDYAGTAETNNITISVNGNKINGSTIDAKISTNREGLTLVYIDATQGWLGLADIYSSTPFLQTYTASYLVIAGGGSGGATATNAQGGGGGAGGYLESTTTLTRGQVYTITVGAGGAKATGYGADGGTSSLIGTGVSISATGGGSGAGSAQNQAGRPGGSGGGGDNDSGAGGAGTSGQGNNGGNGFSNSGGGGGGKGAAGTTSGSNNVGGVGGAGQASSITGSSVTRAGGGGGGAGSPGAGGAGGGGAGTTLNGTATSGTENTGGGGGGGFGTSSNAGSGGSGVVILSIPTASYSSTYTGASVTVTTSGSNTILQFNQSGTYTA
jgi:hypothetical protein